MTQNKSCAEMLAELESDWANWWDGERAYRLSRIAHVGCKEAIPYLFHHLDHNNPELRWRALDGLAELDCRECRQIFIRMHLIDPADDVRRHALMALSQVFDGERDREILQLALRAFDNHANSIAMRLTAGAMMMYQLGIGDETGGPGWWNEDPADLEYPTLLKAVQATRALLASYQSPPGSRGRT